MSNATEKSEHEIVVGAVRDSGKALADKLKWENDFAIAKNGSAINLSATNQVSYNYLFEYLLNEGFVKSGNEVYIELGDIFLYSNSSLSNITYPDFHRKYSAFTPFSATL